VTIFKRSMITLSAAVLGFMLIFAASVLIFMNSFYYEINMKSLENTAKTLMTAIGSDRLNAIFSHNEENQGFNFPLLDADDIFRLTLIAPSGFVLWDSHISEGLVNHIDREEVIAALEGKEGSSRRESISTGMKRIYYSLPVFNSSGTAGVFRLSVSIPGFWARVSPVLIPFTVFFFLFLLAAFWAIIAYSRSLSASFGRLVNIIQPSAPLLSGLETNEPVSPEFLSLEKTLRAMTYELNLRFEQAKSEGSRLEAILNGMSEAVFAMDSSLKLHLLNPKAREIFNLADNTSVLKENTLTLLEATRSTDLAETAKKAISCGASFETELTFHTGMNSGKTNGEQYFQVYASPLFKAGSSENCGAVLVLQDITRLVRLERIRKDFVANVSHELRTPIQLIKGFSETLLDAIPDDSRENIRFIDIIHKNAGIMENLTNDLLMLSSLENSARTSGDMEDFQITPLINEAVSSVEPQAKKKQIEIIVKCEEDLSARLYGSLIIQALINLIDNGIKYSPDKSKLWVSAFLNAESSLVFEVRDKGIGIPSVHLERIFERFYRVDRSSEGTGLGLSIVRHIALLHNGNAEAESQTGVGSVFRIIIPE